jgi:hypothetical protein
LRRFTEPIFWPKDERPHDFLPVASGGYNGAMDGPEFLTLISLLSGAGVIWLRTRDNVTPPTREAASKVRRKGTLAVCLGVAGPMTLPQYWPVYIGLVLVGLAYFRLAHYIGSRIPRGSSADFESPSQDGVENSEPSTR